MVEFWWQVSWVGGEREESEKDLSSVWPLVVILREGMFEKPLLYAPYPLQRYL